MSSDHRMLRPRVAAGSPTAIGWGVLAGGLLAVVAAVFTALDGTAVSALFLPGEPTSLAGLWPLTATSAFLTTVVAWYALVVRPGRVDDRRAALVGLTVGLASHLVAGFGLLAFGFTGDGFGALSGPVTAFAWGLIFGLSSLLIAGWFAVPSSVLTTVAVARLARRMAANDDPA